MSVLIHLLDDERVIVQARRQRRMTMVLQAMWRDAVVDLQKLLVDGKRYWVARAWHVGAGREQWYDLEGVADQGGKVETAFSPVMIQIKEAFDQFMATTGYPVEEEFHTPAWAVVMDEEEKLVEKAVKRAEEMLSRESEYLMKKEWERMEDDTVRMHREMEDKYRAEMKLKKMLLGDD